ncbi:MAG: hypothetical protein ACRCUY_05560 [Thermoguttaceae bacterium]
MYEFRFLLTPNLIPKSLLEKSYFASWGRVPRPTKVIVEGNEMVVRTDTKGSGTIHVLYPHRFPGILIESTESLLNNGKPYCLIKELARGALGRLVRKWFEWQMLGHHISPEHRMKCTQIARRFSKAAVADISDVNVQFEMGEILEELTQLVFASSLAHSEQTQERRGINAEQWLPRFGIGMNHHPFDTPYEFGQYAPFLNKAFQSVLPAPTWRELEPEPGLIRWDLLDRRLSISARFGFDIVMGPLLSFEQESTPDWLVPRLNEDDVFENHATQFVTSIVTRFGDLVSAWILGTQVNSCHLPHISQLRVVNLVRDLAQLIRKKGVVAPILVGIDQPWGEYTLEQTFEYDIVNIAEMLMSCREIDSFLLKFQFGLDSKSSYPRDPIALGSLLDIWGCLGKALYISFSVPSIPEKTLSLDPTIPQECLWSEGLQQIWTDIILRTILSKRSVQGIFWNSLQDRVDDSHPETASLERSESDGLIDSNRVLKLAFKHFSAMQQK